jgi:hypothetical protein
VHNTRGTTDLEGFLERNDIGARSWTVGGNILKNEERWSKETKNVRRCIRVV